jgi:hypothetical protein
VRRAFRDPRYAKHLASAEAAAAPHLVALGLGHDDEVAYTSCARPPGPRSPAALDVLRAVSDDAIAWACLL